MLFRTSVVAFITALVAACGGSGGGGGNTPPPPPPLQAPQVVYPQSTYVFTTGVAIATVVPTVTGGAPTEWTSVPALPAGLTLGASGQITGTPTQASASSTFAVTARNSAGQSSFNLSLTINSGVLLDLGHTSRVEWIRYEGSRILSRD